MILKKNLIFVRLIPGIRVKNYSLFFPFRDHGQIDCKDFLKDLFVKGCISESEVEHFILIQEKKEKKKNMGWVET